MTRTPHATGLCWVDHGAVPPRRLPAEAEALVAYLAEALGHPVYERWTWKRLIEVFGTLPDARRAKPAVCRLLIEEHEAIEAWQRGRLRLLPAGEAPSIVAVAQALLKAHGKRFRRAHPVVAQAPQAAALITLPGSLVRWLSARGRLANPHADTNTLGAQDDAAALAAFLRERACRSRHTFRAYLAELERLAAWCAAQRKGPFSDLTRADLLAYRDFVAAQIARQRAPAQALVAEGKLSARSQGRALAVVASLYRFWHDTGYLLGNPAAGLSPGSRARSGFAPKRFVPAPLLAACDAWVASSVAGCLACASSADLRVLRRAAVWTLYRYGGVRLAELEWASSQALPKLDVDAQGDRTLHVLGKGDKERSIPLPRSCAPLLQAYRVARGLPPSPNLLEQVALIHGEKGAALGARGLYDEVKAVLLTVAEQIETSDAGGAALLRTASPHWLRHAYARRLVVDAAVPLPAAQALLGHASASTIAEYAKTDLTKLRQFVERGFAPP